MSDELKALKESADNNQYQYGGADAALLERFPNPAGLPATRDPFHSLSIEIETQEFTSLCPLTGQPDFATIKIKYVPHAWCVESKSLKLYLGSFRQHGAFHETCITKIGLDLHSLLDDPNFLEVKGEFTPRGGIPFWPTFTSVRKPGPEDDD